MNKHYFISSIVLLWLCCCSVNISRACNVPPVADINDCPKYTAANVPVGFDGFDSIDPDGYIVDWRWSFPPEAYDFYSPHLWQVSCKFSAIGVYTVTLVVEDNEGATDSINCTVYVIEVGIHANSAYIQVNKDDDNDNHIQDRYEFENVDDEDDLVEISLSMEPDIGHGYIKLEVGLFVGTLSVWEDPNKVTKVINPHDPADPNTEAEWTVTGPFSKTLWVEGYHVHNTFPTGCLGISYLHPTQKYTVDSNGVEIRPVEVCLFMDGVDEDNEEFPGRYILYNKDDDNDNGVPDYDDTDDTGEDDLVKIMPHWVEPSHCELAPEYNITGSVTFDVTSGESKVKIWEPNEYYPAVPQVKYKEISLPETYATPDDLPKVFYVEGIEPSDGPRDVEFTLTLNELGYKDTVKVTVVHVEPFIDALYMQPLDDHSKSGGLRSPKYLFGEDDPIYVQVKNIGIDPDEAEYNVVAVTTATSLIYMDLKETGPDTQIFRNSESEIGELLYLSTDDDDDDLFLLIFTPEDKIKVMSEEVMYFWLRIPPTGGGYKRSVDKMVDRAEIGVEWQDHYDYYNYAAFREGYGFSKELYENINTYSGTTWFMNFKYDNLDSQKSHWYYNSDSGYTDSVDIAAWAGHGTYPHHENHIMWFFIDTKPGKEYCVPLYWSEIDWGDQDADWVFIQTCSFLNGSDEELKQLVSSVPGVRGAHLICGFTNECYFSTGKGTYLAEQLGSMSIKQAWFKYCQERQPSGFGVTAKVFGAEECMDDSLAGSGPIEVSRNPTIDSTWTSETFTKP